MGRHMQSRLSHSAPILLLLLLAQWCVTAQSRIIEVCEGNQLQITCPVPTTQVILIRSAMYGRRTDMPNTPGRCGDNVILRKKCEHDVTQYFKFKCEGQPICDVYVDVATFGAEFCVDVMKYVEVEYDCVQSTTMSSVQQCYQKCAPSMRPADPAPHPFGTKPGQSSTKGHNLSSSSQPGSNTVAPPSPPANAARNAQSASPSTNTAHNAQSPGSSRASSHSPSPGPSPPTRRKPPPPARPPSAPSLPYGNLNRSIARSLSRGSESAGPSNTGAPRSAALRASLMARMHRMLQIVRSRKMRRGG